MKAGNRPRFWGSLTLRMFAIVIVSLTLLSMAIAIGSVALHQQQMRAHLPEDAWETATDPALELTLVAPLVLIPPLLFAVAGLWFITKQIVQPLQKLEAKAAALAWGDFGTIQEPVGGISEVQHLQMELSEMANRSMPLRKGCMTTSAPSPPRRRKRGRGWHVSCTMTRSRL